MTKYNGWANRSTWLVELHMQNDKPDIAELYEKAAITATSLEQFKNRVLFLLPHTTIDGEEEFYINEINYYELMEKNK